MWFPMAFLKLQPKRCCMEWWSPNKYESWIYWYINIQYMIYLQINPIHGKLHRIVLMQVYLFLLKPAPPLFCRTEPCKWKKRMFVLIMYLSIPSIYSTIICSYIFKFLSIAHTAHCTRHSQPPQPFPSAQPQTSPTPPCEQVRWYVASDLVRNQWAPTLDPQNWRIDVAVGKKMIEFSWYFYF